MTESLPSYEIILTNTSDNGTSYVEKIKDCSGDIPHVQDLFLHEPWWNFSVLGIGLLLSIVTVVIYLEEVIYVFRHFETSRRRSKTIWVLALYPVFSVTSLIGVLVPRAGTIVDLVGNVFFSTVLYQFVRLMVDYIGGQRNMWEKLGETTVSMRGPPCCCCCFCLPTIHFGPKLFNRLEVLVMQVAIVRPCLMFIAAVMWANGSYQPGVIAWNNGFGYIMVLNLLATFTAVYGLLLIQKTFHVVLESYHLQGKFLSLQLVLLTTAIVNLIISVLVTNELIPCSSVLSSKTRGERIYHSLLVVMMLPLSLLGRGFYRRKEEGKIDPRFRRKGPFVPMDHKEIMTSTMSLTNNNNYNNGNPVITFTEDNVGHETSALNNDISINYTNRSTSIPFADGTDHETATYNNVSSV